MSWKASEKTPNRIHIPILWLHLWTGRVQCKHIRKLSCMFACQRANIQRYAACDVDNSINFSTAPFLAKKVSQLNSLFTVRNNNYYNWCSSSSLNMKIIILCKQFVRPFFLFEQQQQQQQEHYRKCFSVQKCKYSNTKTWACSFPTRNLRTNEIVITNGNHYETNKHNRTSTSTSTEWSIDFCSVLYGFCSVPKSSRIHSVLGFVIPFV